MYSRDQHVLTLLVAMWILPSALLASSQPTWPTAPDSNTVASYIRQTNIPVQTSPARTGHRQADPGHTTDKVNAPQVRYTPTQQCLQRIDHAAALFGQQQTEKSQQQMLALQTSCDEVPHLWHNLAVFAAHEGRWDSASQLLEQSLALDSRAAHSWTALKSIYGYRAAQAYRKALGKSPLANLAKPALELQTSELTNPHLVPAVSATVADTGSVRSQHLQSSAGTVSGTLTGHEANRLENPATTKLQLHQHLFSWWNARLENDFNGWASSYDLERMASLRLAAAQSLAPTSSESSTAQHSVSALTDALWHAEASPPLLPAWESVKLQIELTTADAVAILTFPKENVLQKKLLLLHQQNSEWKIYQERDL